MLARARANQAKVGESSHISFLEGKITSVPLADGLADCIISNCVINLVPEEEKPMVFAEMARLLKPGGRIAIADTIARKPLGRELKESVALYIGCIAGCSLKDQYEEYLEDNGFHGKWSLPMIRWMAHKI
jgi:arsenite methyltransferase